MVGNAFAEGATEALGLCPDVELLRVAQPHVLLIGPTAVTSALLDAIRPTLRQPVVEGLEDVASLPREGTLILRNIESLNGRRQRELFTSMEASAARLVTICEDHLYTRVADGSFLPALYYRLNALMLTADDPTSRLALPVSAGRHQAENRSCRDALGDTTPAPGDVARRAYELYEARGRGEGGERDDWFRAEQELQAIVRSAALV